jgi:hypothetical protein
VSGATATGTKPVEEFGAGAGFGVTKAGVEVGAYAGAEVGRDAGIGATATVAVGDGVGGEATVGVDVGAGYGPGAIVAGDVGAG